MALVKKTFCLLSEMFKLLILFISLNILFINIVRAQDITKLLRYPNTSTSEITFNYGGDIYVVSIKGGYARKITSSVGLEQMPRFSPDGRTIAFIGEYDGNTEIYTVSNMGGEPHRVTYSMDLPDVADRQGPDKIIMQWTSDGKNIIYRSRMESWNVLTGKLYKTSASGGLPEDIPVPRAGFCSFSPTEDKMAYNRIFREYRTWKRYRGGQADDIWIYDFNTKELANITNNSAQDIIPMWAGDKIYFLSDRDKIMNLFCYDFNTKETRKVTNFSKYDIKFPSLGAEHIAFENGGLIYTLKLSNEELQIVDIKVVSDFLTAREEVVDVSKKVSSFDISPDGRRTLLNARGEIFIVPAGNNTTHNITRNITNTSGVHERNASWSPNGDWITFISDKTGDDEVYVINPNGKNITQLTRNTHSYRYNLSWSPDGKKIINSNSAREVTIIDIASKIEKNIFNSPTYSIRDFTWSPDSKWVAYSYSNETGFSIINLYSLEQDKNYKITSDFYSSSGPAFSSDGKYLFFISDRDFQPHISSIEWNFAYLEMSRVYGVCLQDSLESPFLKFIDHDAEEFTTEKTKLSKKEKEALKSIGLQIDLDDLSSRLFVLPVETARYYNLSSIDKKLYYFRYKDKKSSLFYYDFDDMKEVELGDISKYTFSSDGKYVMYYANGNYYLNKTSDKFSTKNGKIDLTDLKFSLNKRAEWTQIFNESWRHFKYFFYDSNMHGLNWDEIKNKYESLLSYVIHRNDLTYIVGEMIGELNVGHAYVTGGDMPKVNKIGIGLLGVNLELEKSTSTYKIKNILKGENWNEKLRSPLTEPGLNIKEGDYLLAIDGNKLDANTTPYKYLVDKVNKFIVLTIKSKSNNSIYDVAVKTIANESDLRYFNWVESRRAIVDSITNGRVAYVHIPDMGVGNGLNWFAKQFYPQVRKEALIIDDRYNGGGNVSPMIIERLRRELVIAKVARNSKNVSTNPSAVMTGPMVCLINEQSMSDGDLFPFQFKELALGPVIGKRSWGGVIGIYGSLPLLDGSSINRPEVANFGAKSGNWELEGVGMVPDIEVDNHPAKEYAGIDEQLLFGINKILELIPLNTKTKIPPAPVYPIKN